VHPRDDLDLVAAIDLGKVHANVVACGGRHVLADEVGSDRKLAMAAVDEDREPDGTGTPVVHERVHSGADRAAGEEHIVDEYDDATVDGERDLRLAHDRRVADPREVVAIERDVDRPKRNVDPLVRPDRRLDTGREGVAARADTDDGKGGEIAVALNDFVRDPRDGPADVVRLEQRGRLALLPGLTGPVVKGGGAVRSIGLMRPRCAGLARFRR